MQCILVVPDGSAVKVNPMLTVRIHLFQSHHYCATTLWFEEPTVSECVVEINKAV